MSEISTAARDVDGRARGSNQSGLRAHNERAVLSLIRRNGEMAKADIARRTGLSAQTASVIMRSLEKEELVIRDEPRRGRVGQPSVPMRLNPNGALSFGLKIGRRSSELVIMDFVGDIRVRRVERYSYPKVDEIRRFVEETHRELMAEIDPALRDRITGLGVAMPFELWSWAAEIGAPEEEMDSWRDFDVEAELSALTGLSVYVANDATGACAAENVFGGADCADFVYFFVGAFAGGGIVINGDLIPGRLGNAAALGSLPIPRTTGGAGQLIEFASVNKLEIMIRESGGDTSAIVGNQAAWDDLGDVLEQWIGEAAYGLAYAILSASAVYDFEQAVIDGAMPRPVLSRLIEATSERFDKLNHKGLSPVDLRPGSVGPSARVLGAASLPLFARFLLDQRVPYAERS
ncbi:Putative transcriptional regulator, ROK family protein [Fulvimarina pelagi HTCC2506]|uniref:Putative transcriptional regulator, ROK family protein n=1 Tax=Fulvimarina pelagi HTCC2506 TaxID=314231 RepID=Q0G499_9HYPH|nr:ROK family transcriptional regulator [Fulvimarina pelagi]EAU41582.1 Putative transcriptional regulator, ROK family protein [Fulvimarina pelagi HTCC2506]